MEKNRYKILCSAPTHFLPEIEDQLNKSYETIYAFRYSKKEIKGLIHDVSAYITDPGANFRIDSDLLNEAHKLKIIVTPSTGSNHIDTDFFLKKGIEVESLKGKEEIIENIHASAEFSFGLLLALIRKLPFSVELAKEGIWREKEDLFRGIELHGKTIGIVGLGRIGKKMVKFSKAFEAKVIYFDPFVKNYDKSIKRISSLKELLSMSDIVCIHVHLDKSTERMISYDEFKVMKKNSYFINTSRGEIVDDAALIDALESKKIAAAGIDVISGEQQETLEDHLLINYARKHENLIITPHIAGCSVDSQRKSAQFALDVLNSFFYGGKYEH